MTHRYDTKLSVLVPVVRVVVAVVIFATTTTIVKISSLTVILPPPTTSRGVVRLMIGHSSLHNNNNNNHRFHSFKMASPSALGSSSSSSSSSSTSTKESYIQVLSTAVSEALGTTIELEMTTGGGSAGGSGATTFVVQEKLDPTTASSSSSSSPRSTSNSKANQQMLYGEYCSVTALQQTRTIRVPKPIAYGNYDAGARTFVILEHLQFAPSSLSSQYELGRQLAQLHMAPTTTTTSSPYYGFHVHNTIGATMQPNLPHYDNWTEFYLHHRLNHMLRLTNHVGMSDHDIEALRNKVREILRRHTTVRPSLVHGDLWGGNQGFCYDHDDDDVVRVVPCIFDPASYYGDREVDIAMTFVFGGFGSDFYRGYQDVYPLAPGHEERRVVYNLYHILNHEVLFGGGYRSQARNMIYEILRM
jgi:fructosamine-3-kinase